MNTSVLMLFTALLVVGCKSSNSKKTTQSNEKTSQSTSPIIPTKPVVSHDLVNQTSSKVTFDEAHKIYLVSPPPTEKLVIKNPGGINANIGFCYEMKMIKYFSARVLHYKEELAKVETSLIEKIKHKNTREDELKLRRGALSAKEIQAFERDISLVSYQIQDLKTEQERFTKRVEFNELEVVRAHKVMLSEGGMAQVILESDLKNNLDQLEFDNPHLTFERATVLSKIPVTFKVVGLESYPAEEIILGLKLHMGLHKEGGQMFITEYLRDLQGTVRLSLYGACPLVSAQAADLGENMKEIVIEIGYVQ